jgi:hypothetical protein
MSFWELVQEMEESLKTSPDILETIFEEFENSLNRDKFKGKIVKLLAYYNKKRMKFPQCILCIVPDMQTCRHADKQMSR